jgi:uncharacterized membrane protein
LQHLSFLFLEFKALLGFLFFPGNAFSLKHFSASIRSFKDSFLLLDDSLINELLLDYHLHLRVKRSRCWSLNLLLDLRLLRFALLKVTTILQLVLVCLGIEHGYFADFDIGVRFFGWTGSHDFVYIKFII